jgi:LAO/AO transport system kinase
MPWGKGLHEADLPGAAALAGRIGSGDRLALARLLTLIENRTQEGLDGLAALYPRTGKAHVIGVTGAPGTGKSTLVNELARTFRAISTDAPHSSAPTVAIVAVDPSSPFSGGAILGDRIRMRDLAGDPGVFIRSMASRGALGGLARGTAEVVQALDAAGFDKILIETVGAGQAEVDIARAAQTTLVVTAPGLGDDVQALKAGILEIADILIVNKGDLPGAESAHKSLRMALDLAPTVAASAVHGHHEIDERPSSVAEGWDIPILMTTAIKGEGIQALTAAVDAHRAYLIASGELEQRERARVRSEMQALLRDLLAEQFLARQSDARYDEALERVMARSIDPRRAVSQLVLEAQGEAQAS